MKTLFRLRLTLLSLPTLWLLPGCQKDAADLDRTLAQARTQRVGAVGGRSQYSPTTDPRPYYYVDAATGNAGNAGTDAGAPLSTIDAAVAKLGGQGGTVYCTGTFQPNGNIYIYDQNDGTASNSLYIRDWPGQSRPVLDGRGAAEANSGTIFFNNTEYVVFQGFEVRNARDGITGCNNQHMRILDNDVHDIYRQGISAWSCGKDTYSQDVIIDGNAVRRAVLENSARDPNRGGWESGIILVKGQNCTLSNNTTYNNYGEGVIAANCDRVAMRNNTSYDNYSNDLYLDNCSNAVVEANLAYNTGTTDYYYRAPSIELPLAALSISDESRDNLGAHVEHNVVRNNILAGGGIGIAFSLGYANSTATDIKVLNNTVYRSFPGKALVEFTGGPVVGSEIRNNVFVQLSGSPYLAGLTSSSSITWGYNNWFGGVAGSQGVAAQATDVNADPLLANPNGGYADANNFKLTASSPVIDKGYGYGAVVPTDFFGTARPAGGGFDLGAHEAAGTASPPPPPAPTGTDFAGYYQVVARHSGKALDVNGFSNDDGGNVIQWAPTNNGNQQWKLEKLTDGAYRLTARHSGKVLDVSGSGQADGTNVQQWTWNGSNAQRWQIEGVGSNYYKLTCKASGKVLDVEGVSTSDGANVHQWTYLGGQNQQWELRFVSAE